MRKPLKTRVIGRTDLGVTELGMGCTALGNMFCAMESEEATATVHAAYAAGIRYFDTAPVYGFGLSETRLGTGIKALSTQEIVISSKVGYMLMPIDPGEQKSQLWDKPLPFRPCHNYSRDAVLR